MARPSKTNPIDAAKLLAKIQAENPRAPVTADDLVRRNQRRSRSRFRRAPFALIQEFVSCFHFDKKGHATLAFRPDDSIIELLAERFREYINGKESLDGIFEPMDPGKRGRSSAREAERIHSRKFGARIMYEGFREDGVSKDEAIAKIAESYHCSPATIRSTLFRDRSRTPTPKK